LKSSSLWRFDGEEKSFLFLSVRAEIKKEYDNLPTTAVVKTGRGNVESFFFYLSDTGIK
jgi:hypothetical protein